ncbi:MAG: hypothetical protein ACK5H5_21615, partial [Microcystis sp.]
MGKTLHPTPYTPHPTPYTPHPTPNPHEKLFAANPMYLCGEMGIIHSSQGELLPISRGIASKRTYTQFLVL